ncbi:hypothetical protein [Micromonospora sp. CB01531]|uniref:hypothetical protein n=1 Tax=Micromonospora sp. CB01531 TaxID=1718947 RepID=UPI000A68BAC1|nr:hypothetical protein [Micromonospora sp. CB01531]
MPKYEIYVERVVRYEKVYEAEHRGDAWKQFYDERRAGTIEPYDEDETYSHIIEVEQDA